MSGRHAAPSERQRRREGRVTETSDYVAGLTRMLDAYGRRIGEDPAALAHLRDLEGALRDAVNVGIYLANKGPGHYSINEQAAILGITKQSVHARVKAGEAVFRRQEAARSAGPLVRLADVRAARAAALVGAGVADVTGSERERAAR
jgi:hypothetical protein